MELQRSAFFRPVLGPALSATHSASPNPKGQSNRTSLLQRCPECRKDSADHSPGWIWAALAFSTAAGQSPHNLIAVVLCRGANRVLPEHSLTYMHVACCQSLQVRCRTTGGTRGYYCNCGRAKMQTETTSYHPGTRSFFPVACETDTTADQVAASPQPAMKFREAPSQKLMYPRLRRLLTASGVDLASGLQQRSNFGSCRHVAAVSCHGQSPGRLGAGRPNTTLRHNAKGNVRPPARLQSTLAVAVTGSAFKRIMLLQVL